MLYSPLLPVHIAGGIVGMLTGTAALTFRKGGRWHVLAGKVFVASMLIMAAGAVYLAVLKHQPGIYDWALLLIPLALGALTWMGGMQKMRRPAPPEDGVPAGMNFFMGTVMLLAAA